MTSLTLLSETLLHQTDNLFSATAGKPHLCKNIYIFVLFGLFFVSTSKMLSIRFNTEHNDKFTCIHELCSKLCQVLILKTNNCKLSSIFFPCYLNFLFHIIFFLFAFYHTNVLISCSLSIQASAKPVKITFNFAHTLCIWHGF